MKADEWEDEKNDNHEEDKIKKGKMRKKNPKSTTIIQNNYH